MAQTPIVHVSSSLSLAQAQAISAGTLAAAREADLLPIAVAVLDAGAHPVHLQREDGCGVLRVDIAIGKAAGALGMGISTRTIRDRLEDRPAFQSALAVAAGGRFVPVPGGVLVLGPDGTAIGAAGVSGDASDRDEAVAIEGIRRAGLRSSPGEPAQGWRNASP